MAVIGGGPAGLMAAEAARESGADVVLFDRMASVGRKFLLAGKGGLNLTHAEPRERFLARYDAPEVRALVARFDADAIRRWAAELGVATVMGSSSRVFPADYKAAPLLRRWLRRLRAMGVRLAMHHHWRGWDGDALVFDTPAGAQRIAARATVFALGGASWPRLGADGGWTTAFAAAGIPITALAPSNCGIEVRWSAHLRERFAGSPLKSVQAWVGRAPALAGECVVTDYGLEGGLVYAWSAALREALARDDVAVLSLDLAPGIPLRTLADALARPRGSRTLATHLKRKAHLEGLKVALLHEVLSRDVIHDPVRLAEGIKALPLRCHAVRPLAEAISTAGGVRFDALDAHLMVRARPGVFVAGEMLDWEAPTGGYLLTACFATGRAAGQGAAAWAMRPVAENNDTGVQMPTGAVISS